MLKKKIKIHPYDRNLVLWYSKNMPKMIKKLKKKLNISFPYDDADGLTISHDDNIYLLLKSFKDPIYQDGVLVHELSHVVLDCFDQSNIPVNFKNQEPFAYLIENLFKRTKKAINKYETNIKTSK